MEISVSLQVSADPQKVDIWANDCRETPGVVFLADPRLYKWYVEGQPKTYNEAGKHACETPDLVFSTPSTLTYRIFLYNYRTKEYFSLASIINHNIDNITMTNNAIISHETPLTVVILAAGKGTRMKSSKAKVLHSVFFRPMLHHVLHAVKPIQPTRTVVIVGHQENAVRNSLKNYDVTIVRQEQQLGTGHAMQMTEPVIPADDGLVMILYGDSPLIRSSSLQSMYDNHRSEQADITVMTTILEEPTGYGRIISNDNDILSIVEEKETDDEQKQIKEINAGIYVVKRKLLFEALNQITPSNTQGEFYLTDIIEYSVQNGRSVQKFINPIPEEVLGVNSRVELEASHRHLQHQRNIELMQQGITMHNIETISVSPFSEVGCDTLLMQNVEISGYSIIGESCVIENGAIIKDSKIGDNVHIGAYSVINNRQIDNNSEVEPQSYLSSQG